MISSQEVSKLEDGCGSHRQATYVTWKGWSSRLEVIYLHMSMHGMKCNIMSVYDYLQLNIFKNTFAHRYGMKQASREEIAAIIFSEEIAPVIF